MKNIIKEELLKELCRKLKKEYICTINETIPTISVCSKPTKENLFNYNWKTTGKNKYISLDEYIDNFSDFFVQGEEAQNLLDDIPEGYNKECYLLIFLESAGVININ